jgi:hypothetical protein
VEIAELDVGTGQSRTIGNVDNVHPNSTRLDSERRVLYLTRAEGRAHNLYGFDLDVGALRKLTGNQIPGVTYSGIEITPRGELLYSRQRTNTDIWRLRLHD